ncbi:MAG: metal-dependent hydrolase with the TIM-barrel fold protein [Promethearchaeota archaeon]|nr:MAG: metal-dependent hydrolase with the TIM-barrel fold protein [Candidatus Lokiarchaeota archaeon]
MKLSGKVSLMQIFHGKIITCDPKDHVYQYLVEDHGKILHVGNELPSEYAKCENRIELGEQALLPAFGDGHIHFSNWSIVAFAYFDVREAKNFEDIRAIIQNSVKTHLKAKIYVGFGISRHSVEEKRLITRTELDAIHFEKPLVIVGYDGHTLFANSAMMEKFPEKVKNARGYHADEGHLFNEAYYAGLDFATSFISPITLIKGIINGYDLVAKKGIGMIHSVESIGFPADLDVTLALLIGRAQSHKNDIQTRLYFQTMDLNKVKKRKLPRIGGCFATALDGCFGACDAALVKPYSNDPENTGILFYSDEDVNKFTTESNRAGLQIQMHAIGSAAVKQGIRALEAALLDFHRDNHRHTLIHTCLIDKEDLAKCAKLGIGITLQPGFLVSPLEPTSYLHEILGDRANISSPMRSIIDAGVHMSGGSDGPVTHPDPIEGIYGACNHPYDPSQSVTIAEALKMYTYEIAWTSFDEKERGSLEAGKIADLVILNQNPLALQPKELRELHVECLFLNGHPYKSGMGIGSMLWHAIRGRKKLI